MTLPLITPELAILLLIAVGVGALMSLLWYRQQRRNHDAVWQAKFNELEAQAETAQGQLRLRLEQEEQQVRRVESSLAQLNEEAAELKESRHQLLTQAEVLAEKITQKDRQLELGAEKQSAYEALLADHNALKARAEAEQESMAAQLKMISESRQQLATEFQALANKIFEEKQQSFAHHSKTTIDASVNPLKEQLQDFRKKVEDVYGKEAAERNQLVGQIAELQKQTRKIGEDALNLANAIKGDNKAQGNWGEVILERLLEESGLQRGREYDLQVSLKSEEGGRRNPDVIIRLPENKDIVIDSKVSLVHYEKYYGAEDAAEKADYLKQHVASLRTHIKQLGAKSYEDLEGIRTLDFVFLFVPVEAAFMLALQEDPGLFREAYDKHIVLVSPTTLLATLRTVENIWRYEKQNKNAEEIARQAGGLYDQFVLLITSFEDIGKQIDKASDAYQTAQKRLSDGRGNLIGRVERLRKLGAKTKKQLSALDTATEALEKVDSEDLSLAPSDESNKTELMAPQAD